MGSERLPGKVLADIEGRPMLCHVVERSRRAELLNEVVVATTLEAEDDAIAELCLEREYPFSRGHPNDVLDRYLRTAQAHSAEVIVRITGDCPLMDPEIIEDTVIAFLGETNRPDYASNRLERNLPIGLDVEVASFGALERAAAEAKEPHQREHVTPYFYENPDKFKIISVLSGLDLGNLRWTVDTQEDLIFVRQVYQRLGASGDFGWREVLALIEREPELPLINAHIAQKNYREAG
jgi:spore coat polysaccharide biosynthesis protein SpsF